MATVERRDPPDLGFYDKRLRAPGVVVRAHGSVEDDALVEAGSRVARLLGRCPRIRANLRSAGAELHVIGRDQVPSDLPMYRHLAGVPFEGALTIDQRGRGYGGLHACCDEDSLLRLPTARHRDHRDIASHELGHTVLSYGLDPGLRAAVADRWRRAVEEGRWVGAYAATNDQEFFAELTMWWVGSRGDHGVLDPPPRDGADGLEAYDPDSHRLLSDLYLGRRVPERIGWDRLAPTAPTDATRSTEGRTRTELVVRNHTDRALTLGWLDYRGERKPYGAIPPHTVRSQSTWATHVWTLEADGVEVGRYRVGEAPGRVDLTKGGRRLAC